LEWKDIGPIRANNKYLDAKEEYPQVQEIVE